MLKPQCGVCGPLGNRYAPDICDLKDERLYPIPAAILPPKLTR